MFYYKVFVTFFVIIVVMGIMEKRVLINIGNIKFRKI